MGRFLDPNFLCFSDTQGFSTFFNLYSPKTNGQMDLCLCGSSSQPFYLFPISSEINFPKAPSSHFDLRNLAIFSHLWPSSLTLEILKLHHLTKLHHSPSHLLHSPRISTSTRERLDLRNSWLNFIYESFGPLRELRHPVSRVQFCSYHKLSSFLHSRVSSTGASADTNVPLIFWHY